MDTLGGDHEAGQHPIDSLDRSPGSVGADHLRGPTVGGSTVHEPTRSIDDGFGIYVSCWGDRWTVRVSGELDAVNAAAVIDVAEVLAARQAPSVDLDFSEITAIDAPGWRAALYAQSVLGASGAGCRLISPPSPLVHPSCLPRPGAGHAA